ncbi:MAG: hypothetical protein JWM57_3779 [Phycisphaerales bacterium]|nr:hypothetical protein [Phycisphaerales bacterium]
MPPYCVVDLKASGDLIATTAYLYADLERIPGCAELIGHLSGELWKAPDAFDTELGDAAGVMSLRWWSTAPTAGLMTLRSEQQVLSVTVLASGIHAEADRLTIHALQQQLAVELHGTRHEAAFALAELDQRPLAATINIRSPKERSLQALTAVADRCFAAAYFRYLHLA